MLTRLRRRVIDLYWQPQLSDEAKAVSRARLTYLSAAKLHRLERGLRRIQAAGVAGDCLEFGVALGGSAIVIAKQMGFERSFAGYDLFGMIPPPSKRDDQKAHDRYRVIASGGSHGMGGDRYYGYETNLLDKVKGSFIDFGLPVDDRRIRLVPGLFEDTVTLDGGTCVAFAHIDCDWFDPVTLCLERTYRCLSQGGIVVLDDYNDFDGCRRATDEFLARHPDMRLIDTTHNAIVVKQ